jgi:hAT family C-terminal dimerisation region
VGFYSLAIPAMSTECERVFSGIKKLITPERNKLHIETMEASECLKNWWGRGLIKQRNRALKGPNADEDGELQAPAATSLRQRRELLYSTHPFPYTIY